MTIVVLLSSSYSSNSCLLRPTSLPDVSVTFSLKRVRATSLHLVYAHACAYACEVAIKSKDYTTQNVLPKFIYCDRYLTSRKTRQEAHQGESRFSQQSDARAQGETLTPQRRQCPTSMRSSSSSSKEAQACTPTTTPCPSMLIARIPADNSDASRSASSSSAPVAEAACGGYGSSAASSSA